jgi:hypothetical protein
VRGSAQNPLTLNRYLYALANPATFIDPSGHSTDPNTSYACLNGYAPASYCSGAGYVTTNEQTAAELEQIDIATTQAALQQIAAQACEWSDGHSSASCATPAPVASQPDYCPQTAYHAAGCGPTGESPATKAFEAKMKGWNDYQAQLQAQAAAEAAAKAAAANRDCGFAGLGCVNIDPIGALGAVVDYGLNHLDQAFIAVGAAVLIGACVVATAGVCGAIVMGAVMGAAWGAVISGGIYAAGCLLGAECSLGGFIGTVAMGAAFGAVTGGALSGLGAARAGAQAATKAAQLAESGGAQAAEETVGHHVIPRAILRMLPDDVAKAVRGKPGAPNIWQIPEGLHKWLHGGGGIPGGSYNQWWKDALRELGGAENATASDIMRLKDAAADAFGLLPFKP